MAECRTIFAIFSDIIAFFMARLPKIQNDENKKTKIGIQRYKGLGEMLADQLWETTMDPDARILRKVTVQQGEEASELFSVLMGDIVAPRREFIQEHAMDVVNLDA